MAEGTKNDCSTAYLSVNHCHPFATVRMPCILKSVEVCDFSHLQFF